MWGEMTYIAEFSCRETNCLNYFKVRMGPQPDVVWARRYARKHGWGQKFDPEFGDKRWVCPEHVRVKRSKTA